VEKGGKQNFLTGINIDGKGFSTTLHKDCADGLSAESQHLEV
jgi:hypothetical protein